MGVMLTCQTTFHKYGPNMTKAAKPSSSDPVSETEIADFLKGHSDFSFEVNVLMAMQAGGFACQHGGTYDDPVTSLPRQFDIRATKKINDRIIRLAVECKNIRKGHPLLMFCMPRTEDESFNELFVDCNATALSESSGSTVPYGFGMAKMRGASSTYKVGEQVGKACVQITRDGSGKVVGDDKEVYTKWAQAISSAKDLTYNAMHDRREGAYSFSFVCPVLVLPNDSLFLIRHDSKGTAISQMEPVRRCSYFINREYKHFNAKMKYVLSHMEFVTLDGLSELLNDWGGSSGVEENFSTSAMLQLAINNKLRGAVNMSSLRHS